VDVKLMEGSVITKLKQIIRKFNHPHTPMSIGRIPHFAWEKVPSGREIFPNQAGRRCQQSSFDGRNTVFVTQK